VAARAAGWFYLRWRQSHELTDKDTIVLADFTNTTGDSIFDGTLQQGLAVQLEQSPFLSIVSDSRIAETLALMTQLKDARLTQKLAREVCQRTASAATIEGSISSKGGQYVVGLRAVNCRSGDLLAEEQVTANGKAQVLSALGEAATKMGRKLGESLASVQKYSVPPSNVTTGSLEALQVYSQGARAQVPGGDDVAAIPLFRRAISLDPNFAMAFTTLGACYSNIGETARAAESVRRAYELRERVSKRERFEAAPFPTSSASISKCDSISTASSRSRQPRCRRARRRRNSSFIPPTFLSGLDHLLDGARYAPVFRDLGIYLTQVATTDCGFSSPPTA